MKNETLKIGVACFVGASVGVIVALAVITEFWWLGCIAGSVVGYFAYEFRTTLHAVPMAWKAARKITLPDTGAFVTLLWERATKGVKATGLFVWRTSFLINSIFLGAYFAYDSSPATVKDRIATFLVIGGVLWVLWLVSVLFTVATCGALLKRKLKYRWLNTFPRWTMNNIGTFGSLRSLIFPPLLIVALSILLSILIWDTARTVVKAVRFVGLVVQTLLVFIHSYKRVLCAVDSALGCVASYIWLAEPNMTDVQKVIMVFLGGIIGAGLGILNWELVSKRWLHLDQPKTSNA